MHGCCWLVAALLCWLATVWGQQDDSLRGALEAISRRQRDLGDSGYYMNRGVGRLHVRPDDEIQFYDSRNGFQEDGQPEDIGYGYQKSVAPHTSGLFEPIPLPSSELGSHDNFGNIHFSEKELERLVSDFPRGDIESNRFAYTFPRSRLPSSSTKRSIFRERGDASSPDVLQNLYSKHDSDAAVARPALLPSSFRERIPARPLIPSSVLALVRRYGGLGRDSENGPGDDDTDEYLTELNSIWEKYKSNGPEGFDPEELSESDIEELMKYFGNKQDKKRYDSYANGYDYFNSPLTWTKRTKQNLETPAVNNGFFHALKFLSKNRDVLESLHDEDEPNEDEDEDVAKLLSEQLPSFGPYPGRNNYIDSTGYTQNPRHDTFNSYHNRISKRFPVTKRSSSFGEHGKHVTQKHADNKQRWKKNVGDGDLTDPKVAQEINNIFSTPGNEDKGKKGHINDHVRNSENVSTTNSEDKIDAKTGESAAQKRNTSGNNNEHAHHLQRRDKDVGQKEESDINSYAKPLQVKKKSIDWSNYFGIDRRKKSVDKNANEEWLLNQYLKAYSLNGQDPNHSNELVSKFNRKHQLEAFPTSNDDETQDKGPDDIDDKLRAMEDIIVDEALKYTGAHEGITDSKEIQKVKDRVLTKLAAAYSLEKMRRALGEFKSSMEAQKESSQSQNSTPKPEDKEEQKEKRVAIKKEKAELNEKEKKLEKKSDDDNLSYVPLNGAHSSYSKNFLNFLQSYQDDDTCPLEDLAGRCRQISAIDWAESNLLLPICTYHQLCSMCGVGFNRQPNCDALFLAETSAICRDNAQCRFAAGRMLMELRTLRGSPSPEVCDLDNPCVARFLTLR